MNGLGLARPEWAAPLLGAWGLLALAAALACWRARRALSKLGARGLRAGGARDAALAAALLCVAVALLGPQLGTRTVAVPADGIDLVVAVDVSRSMDAADAAPSRLARAREAARGLLLGLAPGDRAALAVYAGHGALLTPLTHDAGALVEMVPALDTEWMTDRGSRPWAGVEAALSAFEAESARPRVVVLLGDGERAHLAPNDLFEALPRAQVRVVAGAIGSEGGAALMGPAGPLLDWSGETVVTRRETRGFERFAAASGGEVLLADEWGALDPAVLLAAAKRGLRPGPGGTVLRELPRAHTALPAAVAFALLLVECLAGARLRIPRRAGVAAAALLALGAGSAPLSELEARVAGAPEDARALIALGVARAEAGDPEEAVHAFSAAVVRAREPELVALASYDLGVALLELGDFAGASDAFFDALAHAPGDRQAKFNLEWALRALAKQAPPPPPQPDAEPPPEREEADEPRPAPEPKPEPEPTAESPTGQAPTRPGEGAPGAPREPLSLDEVARWLDAVRDVPPAAARRAHDPSGGPRSGPQW